MLLARLILNVTSVFMRTTNAIVILFGIFYVLLVVLKAQVLKTGEEEGVKVKLMNHPDDEEII